MEFRESPMGDSPSLPLVPGSPAKAALAYH